MQTNSSSDEDEVITNNETDDCSDESEDGDELCVVCSRHGTPQSKNMWVQCSFCSSWTHCMCDIEVMGMQEEKLKKLVYACLICECKLHTDPMDTKK